MEIVKKVTMMINQDVKGKGEEKRTANGKKNRREFAMLVNLPNQIFLIHLRIFHVRALQAHQIGKFQTHRLFP